MRVGFMHGELGPELLHAGAAEALRQHDRVRRLGHDGLEVGVRQFAAERVDAHDQARAGRAPARLAQESGGGRASGGLGGRRDGILEIDDQRVGLARQRLGELFFVVAGDEQQRAHGVRPRRWRAPAGGP
jgi:hypothetical protein